METKKIIALLSYLKNEKCETELQDLDIIDNTILSVDGWEYYVLDEEEREEIFKEQQEQLWDDMGLESFSSSFVDEILNHCLNKVKLYYLGQYELIEYNEETEEDEPLGRSYGYDNPIEYIYKEIDSKTASEIITKYDLLDFEELCKRVVMWDGYAPTLARYDGEEIELGEYYAYLIG